eukprot:768259-Hanusia_phi.AAC.8
MRSRDHDTSDCCGAGYDIGACVYARKRRNRILERVCNSQGHKNTMRKLKKSRLHQSKAIKRERLINTN